MTDRQVLPALATRDEAAAALRVSTRTVDRLIKAGYLDAVKVKGSVRISAASLARVYERGTSA